MVCDHDRQDDVCWECKDAELARLLAERDALTVRVKALETVMEASSVLVRLQNQIMGNFDAPEDVNELEAFFAALDKIKNGGKT